MLTQPNVNQRSANHTANVRSEGFLSRCWNGFSGTISYIITHPLQAITAGLAAQSAIAMGNQAIVDLSTLNGSTGFELTGVSAYDYSGYSVASAGDVNGDGIGDLIIGAPFANSAAGASYVVFGHPGTWTSPLSLATLNGTNGFSLMGVAANDQTGCSIASAGDVNGDGINDLIIGAYGVNNNAGASYVVFGHTGVWSTRFSPAALNGINGFSLTGVANDRSGFFVASAGDVNGDGIGDLIIGAPLANSAAGASYVVFGHTGVWSTRFSPAALNGTNGFILTSAAGDQNGRSVASAGDVNGDGIGDLVIGVSGVNNGAGASYVVFGHTGAWANPFKVATLNGTNGFTLTGVFGADSSGCSVASAGDVNGDGIGDLVIGAYGANNSAGASHVVFGHTGAWTSSFSLAALNGVNGFTLTGITRGYLSDRSGYSVASAGDVNGDGITDLIVGAPYANNLAGASYVVFGHTGTWTSPLSLATLDGVNGFTVPGVFGADYSGFSVASAGDVNGDGIDDLVIGAYSGGNNRAGSSYVVFGVTASPTPTASFSDSRSSTASASATPAPTVMNASGEFHLNIHPYGIRGGFSVAGLAGGGFVVIWQSNDGQDGGSGPAGIYGQQYDAKGLVVGNEFQISPYSSANGPVVAGLADGGFVVVSQDSSLNGNGFYGRLYALPSIVATISISGTAMPSVAIASAIPSQGTMVSPTQGATKTFAPTMTVVHPSQTISPIPCDVHFRTATILATLMTEAQTGDGADQYRLSPKITMLFNRITNNETIKEKLRQTTAQNICQKYLASPTPAASHRKIA